MASCIQLKAVFIKIEILVSFKTKMLTNYKAKALLFLDIVNLEIPKIIDANNK